MTPQPVAPNAAFRGIRLLSCDVDGVMTDGGLYYDHTGHVLARFHVLDGMGIKRLMAIGVKVCFLSQSATAAIAARARALGIDHCEVGVEDKLAALRRIADEEAIDLSAVCHIADDVNDLPLLQAVGVAVTVPNGVPEVHEVCRFVTRTPGGHGAVRELCEAIIASKRQPPV
jgi:3-deoxy-D-manno-octulosonate 8-phosphate phosphatase (KDO 8-P phosphatase)